jgi:ribonuclease HII
LLHCLVIRDSAIDRFEFERGLIARGIGRVAGVDEAGRGPLAGPVTAAAVILPQEWVYTGLPSPLTGLNDSKQLSRVQRERFFEVLTTESKVLWNVQIIPADIIDAINILRATHLAMNQALAALNPAPEHALVDGLPVRSMTMPQTALVKGDSRSFSIAAASVLAKVTRDRLMAEFDLQYPGYGFATHKGYGTASHLAAISRLGPCPIHRRSFAPLKESQLDLFPRS